MSDTTDDSLSFIAEAQDTQKVRRIRFLSGSSAPSTLPRYQAFEKGLRDLGWVKEKNISIEYRFAEGKREQLHQLAGELLDRRVEIVVVEGGEAARVVKTMSTKLPVVMAEATAPVERGLVQSLARPGGNITGLSLMAPKLIGKRLELLKEVVPKLSRVAVLWNPGSPAAKFGWQETQLPARQLGLQLYSLEVGSPDNFDKALKEAVSARAGALAAMPGTLLFRDYKRIADLSNESKLPSIHHEGAFADSGGLVAYGVDRSDLFRRGNLRR